MIALQLACVAIVLVNLGIGLRRAAEPRRYMMQYGLLVLAAWAAEDSCIRRYGFYAYAPDWWLFVDQVPLLIVLIWPCVILSARELARDHPLLGAAVVLTDAALIEPIAVAAGLWHWTEPGLFGVPPIGILGWSIFAFWALALIERRPAWLPVLVPLLTHGGLVACWWGGLRWVNRPVWAAGAVGLAWAVSALVCWRARSLEVNRVTLLSRIPGALFFFVLLALYGVREPMLVAWSLAFVPPYLVLSFRS